MCSFAGGRSHRDTLFFHLLRPAAREDPLQRLGREPQRLVPVANAGHELIDVDPRISSAGRSEAFKDIAGRYRARGGVWEPLEGT